MWCGLEYEPIEILFRQVGHLYMQKSIQMLKEDHLELRGGQAGILFVLKFKGGMSQRELAEQLHLSAPSITAAIRKIESSGYVERKQDENDQRIMRLTLTPKGVDYVEHIIKAAKDAEELSMRNISKEEQLLLRRILTQMRDNLAEGKKIDYLHPSIERGRCHEHERERK